MVKYQSHDFTKYGRGLRSLGACLIFNKLCRRPPQYDPAPASWPTYWPWKWCPSHVWRWLPLCQF